MTKILSHGRETTSLGFSSSPCLEKVSSECSEFYCRIKFFYLATVSCQVFKNSFGVFYKTSFMCFMGACVSLGPKSEKKFYFTLLATFGQVSSSVYLLRVFLFFFERSVKFSYRANIFHTENFHKEDMKGFHTNFFFTSYSLIS